MNCTEVIQFGFNETNAAATHAVKAAKNIKNWGYYAACMYAAKRHVTPLMWHHAVRIENREEKRA